MTALIRRSAIVLALGVLLVTSLFSAAPAAADDLPSGTDVTTGPYPSDGDIHVVVVSNPGAQTIGFPDPDGPVEGLFSTVTSYVSGAVIYFESDGTTYSKSITPNSNTLMTFPESLDVSDVRVTIQDRGYPDDAVHAGYFYAEQESEDQNEEDYSLPDGTDISTGQSYPEEFTNVWFMDLGPQTKSIPSPENGEVIGVWATVTTYVDGAVLHFEADGEDYSWPIEPNSNTLLAFEDELEVDDVEISIEDRGYPDDQANVGYVYLEFEEVDDYIPDGTDVSTGITPPEGIHNVVFSNPGAQTKSFPSPSDDIIGIWTSVTTYVEGAVLYFEIDGETYSKLIAPNSNTLLEFEDPLDVSDVRIAIEDRGYSDDQGNVAYIYADEEEQVEEVAEEDEQYVLPSGTDISIGEPFPDEFYNVVFTSAGSQTKSISSPASGAVLGIFATVTTYVEGAVLSFYSDGNQYSYPVEPNSNTLFLFEQDMEVYSVKISIDSRGYSDDQANVGYVYLKLGEEEEQSQTPEESLEEQVDEQEQVQETQEQPEQQYPDLYVADLSWSPENPLAGEHVTFTYRETNKGSSGAGSHRITLYIDNVATRIIEAGSLLDSTSRSGSFASWECDDKVHDIRVFVDSGNSVSESNESNNTWIGQFACTTITIVESTAESETITKQQLSAPTTLTISEAQVSISPSTIEENDYTVAYVSFSLTGYPEDELLLPPIPNLLTDPGSPCQGEYMTFTYSITLKREDPGWFRSGELEKVLISKKVVYDGYDLFSGKACKLALIEDGVKKTVTASQLAKAVSEINWQTDLAAEKFKHCAVLIWWCSQEGEYDLYADISVNVKSSSANTRTDLAKLTITK